MLANFAIAMRHKGLSLFLLSVSVVTAACSESPPDITRIRSNAGADDLSTFSVEDFVTEVGEPTNLGFTGAAFTTNADGSISVGEPNKHFVLLSPETVLANPGEVFSKGIQIESVSDDDFIGLVLGMNAGDATPDGGSSPLNNSADYLLFQWKDQAQADPGFAGPLADLTVGGDATQGATLARVTGVPSVEEFWKRSDDAGSPGTYTPLTTATGSGAGSYDALGTTCLGLRYTSGSVEFYANGEKVIDTTAGAPYPSGRWGVYFFAQAGVTLRTGDSFCPGDADGDGIPDVDDGDDDNDGIPDTVESGGLDVDDSDSDGVPDFAQASFPGFVDSNSDGIDDRFDVDLDGIPNHLDLDSDADGIFDLIEGNDADGDRVNDNTSVTDANADGQIDSITDGNSNGIDDSYDTTPASAPDSNGNGTANFLEVCTDGYLTGSEECDDGNSDDDDGCTVACIVEDGFSCTGEPSLCSADPDCGDGNEDIGESCDLGAGVNGPTASCSTSCKFNIGFGTCTDADDCEDAGAICDEGTCQFPSGEGPCSVADQSSSVCE